MHAVLLMSVLLGVLYAKPLRKEWQLWKERHGKNYMSALEEESRWAAWLQNHQPIQKHNSQNSTFRVKLNQFADMVRRYT